MMQNSNKGMLIYNLFPRLIGPMPKWSDFIAHIKKLGFNWIYVNPFQYTGFSGSLYAIKHHFVINPLFIDQHLDKSAEEQLIDFIHTAHTHKIKVMMDLVLRYTSIDSPLIEEHPEWYLWDEFNQLQNPTVWENNQWRKWGDLALINNADSPDKGNLWQYWNKMTNLYIRLGFDGFLCDQAHTIPLDLWDFLIKQSRRTKPDIAFVAQTLGGTIENDIKLCGVGFDSILNSSKFWDFQDKWCINQYMKLAPFPTISFPEYHTTPRLAKELNDNWQKIKQRYLFSAVFSTGLLMPIGFEFGSHKKLDSQRRMPTDFEQVREDLTCFIRDVNTMKKKYPIFNQEAPISLINRNGYSDICGLIKSSMDSEEQALILINRNDTENVKIKISDFTKTLDNPSSIKDVTPETKIHRNKLVNMENIEIPAAGIKVFYFNS